MSFHQHLLMHANRNAIWIANTDAQGVPALVRSTGVIPSADGRELLVFIPEVFSRDFRANLRPGAPVTFLGTDVPTYLSFQYKGFFKSIRPCTVDEVAFQETYLDEFTDVVVSIGFSKEGFYKSYAHQPSFAVAFEISEVFDQSPYKGTGVRVTHPSEENFSK